MTMAKRLFLLRHGKTDAGGRYIGSTDLPLAAEGVRDIERIAPILRHEKFDAIFCSPMLRCRHSLNLLEIGQTPLIFDELREVDFGRWEGLTFSEICRQDEEIVESWSRWSEDFSFPQGESIVNFLGRIERIKKMVAEGPDERLLLVTHGGVIRQFICSCLGLTPEKYILFDVQPGLYSIVDLYQDGGVLVGLNQGGN